MKGTKFSTSLLLVFVLMVAHIPLLPLTYSETELPDLEVSLTAEGVIRDTYNHLSNGSSTALNATVVNRGNVSASDVVLQLLVNGNIVLNATTPKLEIDHEFWAAYYWAPEEDADYNLTVYTSPVSGEDDTANNNVTKWVRVCPDLSPNPVFNYSRPTIRNQYITFNASSSNDPDWGGITTYSWNFNGTPKVETSPIATHKFTSYGKATVTLTVYDTEGKNNSTSEQLTIYARPIANFIVDNPSPYIVNQTLTFNATASYDPDNITATNRGIACYIWNFGDGNITIIGDNETITPIVNHVFTAEGSYNVVLAVIDLDGIMSSPNCSMLVSVSLGRPVALFKPPSEPCYVCHQLLFDASDSYDQNNSTAYNNGIVSYRWDFDDGNVTTIAEPTITHHYEEYGSYNVNLTVTDSDGLTASIIKTVNVIFQVLVNVVDNTTGTANAVYNPGEMFRVNITVIDVVDLHSFEFNLTYSCIFLTIENVELGNFLGNQGDINWDREFPSCQGYAWARGERLLSGGVSGNGTLAIITFRVNNRTGNCTLRISSSILKNSSEIYINHTQTHGIFYTTKPVASFTHLPEYPSVNEDIVFDASESYDPDNTCDDLPGILNYTWNFGDDTTISVVGTIENPPSPTISHNYTANGTHQAMLLVTDDDGETWNFTHQIDIGYTHDVAVISVQPFQFAFNETLDVYETSGMLQVNVTVINIGDTPGENISVTLYVKNATQTIEIETKSIYLSGSIPKNLTLYVYAFKWNLTHGLPKGDYTIGANVTLSGDVNPTDNSCEDGVVRVYLAGDINLDDKTDMKDIGIVVKAFGSTPASSQWNPHCDLKTDSKIDMKDIGIAVKNFGKTSP